MNGSICVFIDNNVWDFLFARKLDLAQELSRPDFRVFVTREAEKGPLLTAYEKGWKVVFLTDLTGAACHLATSYAKS